MNFCYKCGSKLKKVESDSSDNESNYSSNSGEKQTIIYKKSKPAPKKVIERKLPRYTSKPEEIFERTKMMREALAKKKEKEPPKLKKKKKVKEPEPEPEIEEHEETSSESEPEPEPPEIEPEEIEEPVVVKKKFNPF